jgi:hypothetical protein
MAAYVEVWPVVANSEGIWLVTGGEPWRPYTAIASDSDPHWEVEEVLAKNGVKHDVRLVHSTSWRMNSPGLILTYVAILKCPQELHKEWPSAVAIDISDSGVDKPEGHGPTEAPTPRLSDVLMHGLRHLRFLRDTDTNSCAAMDDAWRAHLERLTPALAGMYVEDVPEATLPGLPASHAMPVFVEVWPLAIDRAGLWLVSGIDPIQSVTPVPSDSEPLFEAQLALSMRDIRSPDLLSLQGTSWRVDGNILILTYVAALRTPDFVRSRWPNALPVNGGVAESVGKPIPHEASDPPIPRYIDVLFHALRELSLKMGFDQELADRLGDDWGRLMIELQSTLDALYLHDVG